MVFFFLEGRHMNRECDKLRSDCVSAVVVCQQQPVLLVVVHRSSRGAAAALLVRVRVLKARRLLHLGGLFLQRGRLVSKQRQVEEKTVVRPATTPTLRLEKLPMKERPVRLLLLGLASSAVSVPSSLFP